ncbi:MAG: TonB-dependent receptor [Gemmatimonadetes bacterium]|nr:TonB-dependent receptor [Gemmatimonadota bacterium]
MQAIGADRSSRLQAVTIRPGEVADVRLSWAAQPVLNAVVVRASQPLRVLGRLPDTRDGVLYVGKKSEVLLVDSIQANLAQDVERQILGRIPGATFSETQGAGFPSNGVAFRGLNPTQSVELNVRQNGVSIAGDLFGYPETYYTPPSEALERIEVVRGAGSLAFGPQFGGAINYVTRDGARNSPLAVGTSLTAGSDGLLNSFTSATGGGEAWTYYAFVHGRGVRGLRPNADLSQLTLFGRVTYQASPAWRVGVELTTHDNRIHMPGGLSDSAFAVNPWSSMRARNWLASPWSIAALRAHWAVSSRVQLDAVLSHVSGDRHLVWRNEDGGAGAPDAIDPATGTFVPRELERETMDNTTLDARLHGTGDWLGVTNVWAVGLRLGRNVMVRQAGGTGSTAGDFDMRLLSGTWETDLRFVTDHAALFAEDALHLGDRLTLVPGVRIEAVRATASGHTDVATSFAPRTFVVPLLGLGAEYALTGASVLYANVSQAYRPVLSSSLTPFGSIARVDPGLRTAQGYNADIGWRGRLGEAATFDVGAFYLSYRDHIGTRTLTDASGTFDEVANIGTSEHRGLETYVELDPLALLDARTDARGSVVVFSSAALIDARYVTGAFAGRLVELAPRLVQRVGLSLQRGGVATTLQVSATSASFGNANNDIAPASVDGAAGVVPGYRVLDWSLRVPVRHGVEVSASINNLLNARYFTKRTDEYPGPGILPGLGRTVSVGVRLAR